MRRDQKGLYSSGKSVVGIDLPFDEPDNSDIVIENDGMETPEEIVKRLEAYFFDAAGAEDNSCIPESSNALEKETMVTE